MRYFDVNGAHFFHFSWYRTIHTFKGTPVANSFEASSLLYKFWQIIDIGRRHRVYFSFLNRLWNLFQRRNAFLLYIDPKCKFLPLISFTESQSFIQSLHGISELMRKT